MKKEENKTENTSADKSKGKSTVKASEAKNTNTDSTDNNDEEFPGYPHYPASEDIYNNEQEVDLNPENLSQSKKATTLSGEKNEKNFRKDFTRDDVDVPGSKNDEAKANSGKEDKA